MSLTEQSTEQVDVNAGKRAAFVNGLRALADLIETSPDMYQDWRTLEYNLPVYSAEEMARTALKIGGTWNKKTLHQWFSLDRELGGGVTVSVHTNRENVCERVQIGVEKRMVPDPGLMEELPLVEIEEPIYAWECPDSLLEGVRVEDFTGPLGPETDESRPF